MVCAAGAGTPRGEWDLAEGSTLAVFQEYITVQNPSNADAQVAVSYGLEGAAGKSSTLTVRAHSRATVDVNAPLQAGSGQTGVSARVESANGIPILVERPMYFARDLAGTGSPLDGGHVAPGSAPQSTSFFAEGTVLPGWSEFLTLFNPGAATVSVTVDYLLEGAPPQRRTYDVAAGTRRTV